MKNHIRLCGQTARAVTAMFLFGFALSLSAAQTESTQVRKLFTDPPRQYTSAPLWVWNDLLTEEQIRGTMRDLAGQNVKQVFVHPRPGLMTPYLSGDWFRLWKAALDEAERLDMNVWIYDENSYPSGFAGGWVPELMPESRGRGLRFRQSSEQPTWGSNVLAVFMRNGDRLEDVTQQVKAGEKLSGKSYIAATVERAQNSPWHGGRCYVDLLFPGVTEKFLEVTMGAYEREIGRQFGKRVPGVFTDEPELQPAGGLPWTDDLPEQFEKRWGYSLIANLPSLTQPVGDWRKVRHDYYSTLLRLFIERWGKPYYDYCERRGLEFTGHYWEHEWPNCTMVPDNMAMAAWQQRPGIDILMNQYAENTRAQFGNVRSCREIASVANQLGRGRTLVELYGAGGWDLRFEDMKRIGDWLQVHGVNTLNEHLSYVTIRGARKNDHPQSFSYHEPWWPAYNALAKYFSRLTAALTQGEQINRILVVEPTTTAWMYQGDAAALNRLGSEFFNLLMSLESA
ncbi:MAG: glycosyl hydrolase, partial [Verrucomicrobiota bacterium]|nr:glycosyl hydrolase [Verrucomicrobiota bacterium]